MSKFLKINEIMNSGKRTGVVVDYMNKKAMKTGNKVICKVLGVYQFEGSKIEPNSIINVDDLYIISLKDDENITTPYAINLYETEKKTYLGKEYYTNRLYAVNKEQEKKLKL